MKTKQIKNVRIYLSDKKATIPLPEAINRLHIRWIEQELGRGKYDRETKLRIIDGIIWEVKSKQNILM